MDDATYKSLCALETEIDTYRAGELQSRLGQVSRGRAIVQVINSLERHLTVLRLGQRTQPAAHEMSGAAHDILREAVKSTGAGHVTAPLDSLLLMEEGCRFLSEFFPIVHNLQATAPGAAVATVRGDKATLQIPLNAMRHHANQLTKTLHSASPTGSPSYDGLDGLSRSQVFVRYRQMMDEMVDKRVGKRLAVTPVQKDIWAAVSVIAVREHLRHLRHFRRTGEHVRSPATEMTLASLTDAINELCGASTAEINQEISALTWSRKAPSLWACPLVPLDEAHVCFASGVLAGNNFPGNRLDLLAALGKTPREQLSSEVAAWLDRIATTGVDVNIPATSGQPGTDVDVVAEDASDVVLLCQCKDITEPGRLYRQRVRLDQQLEEARAQHEKVQTFIRETPWELVRTTLRLQRTSQPTFVYITWTRDLLGSAMLDHDYPAAAKVTTLNLHLAEAYLSTSTTLAEFSARAIDWAFLPGVPTFLATSRRVGRFEVTVVP